MKKIQTPFLLLGAAFLTIGCSSNSIAGTYGFQMGKETGTHFGIYIKLTDKYTTISSEPDETKKYKECEFSFNVGFNGEEEKNKSITNILTLIATLLNQDDGTNISVPAYYYKTNIKNKDGQTELKVGVDFAFIKNIFDEVDLDDIDFPVLSPELIEKVIYTTYANNVVTMYIPVGQEDIIYQLYWYGIDITYSSSDGLQFIGTPFEAHQPGTHPTAEDVTKINEEYKYGENHAEFSTFMGIDLTKYRDYYTLAMGLSKK